MRPGAGDHEADSKLLRYRLVEALVPLAAGPEEQIAYLDRTRSDTDDLVNDFADWAIYWTPRLEAEGLVPGRLVAVLHAIAGRLTDMTERPDTSLWTDEALRTLDDWREIRALSAAALESFRGMGIRVPLITDELLKPLDSAPEVPGDR